MVAELDLMCAWRKRYALESFPAAIDSSFHVVDSGGPAGVELLGQPEMASTCRTHCKGAPFGPPDFHFRRVLRALLFPAVRRPRVDTFKNFEVTAGGVEESEIPAGWASSCADEVPYAQ